MTELTVNSLQTESSYQPTGDGGVLIRKVRHQRKTTELFDVFAHFWGIVMADLHPGTVGLSSQGQLFTGEGPSALLIPPASLIHWQILKPATLPFQALIYPGLYPDHWPQQACIFPLPTEQWPKNRSELGSILESPMVFRVVEKMEIYNTLAMKLKKAIDKDFMLDRDTNEYAADLNITRDALTKYFRRCFGLSPIEYRNHLRLSHALFSMVFNPENVNEISREVGFKSLRNFNRQFAKFASFRPSQVKRRRT